MKTDNDWWIGRLIVAMALVTALSLTVGHLIWLYTR